MAFAQALAARDLKATRLTSDIQKQKEDISRLKVQIERLSALLTPEQVTKALGRTAWYSIADSIRSPHEIALQRASVRLVRVPESLLPFHIRSIDL